jgi:hypothetical protein
MCLVTNFSLLTEKVIWGSQGPWTVHLANFVGNSLKKYLEMSLQKVLQSVHGSWPLPWLFLLENDPVICDWFFHLAENIILIVYCCHFFQTNSRWQYLTELILITHFHFFTFSAINVVIYVSFFYILTITQ